ncbi:MAG TPA: triose-phosphate isomerase [Candidatus Limnocylindria bacterium]|nr:triose-phosphate isomerase [Candidatus Limnocylindria bacterium]
MNKKYTLVANWKMQLPYNQAKELCSTYQQLNLTHNHTSTIVVCPSFETLSYAAQTLPQKGFSLGAQTCSTHKTGAYTGDVSAQSLAQLGCSYCIIGHSERRMHQGETSHDVATKMLRLLEHGIHPIICIGETEHEHHQGLTVHTLHEQLEPVIQALVHTTTHPTILIAYEPIWSIGSGNVPTRDYLTKIFTWLDQLCTTLMPNVRCKLLYGGSVDEKNSKDIASVDHVHGFLVGGASLDFQKFKNIVSLISE